MDYEQANMLQANGEQSTRPEPLLLSAAEAAEALRISVRHFYKLHSSGRVPRPVRLGRATRWRAQELIDWLEAGAPARARWEASRPTG